jgi:uncharacterized UPF0146 family protein
MSVNTIEALASHIGHSLVCVGYGGATTVSVAVECETCNVVLIDLNREDNDADARTE